MLLRHVILTGIMIVLYAGFIHSQPKVNVTVKPGVHVTVGHPAPPPPPRHVIDMSYSVDFSDLNDYGEWVYHPELGTVWQPYADPGWRPFKYGRWLWTSDGWMWDSYEPFGWVVCHYGYWYHDPGWGWTWVPGYEWSPARVEWYVTDFEIGWAPLLPPARPGFVIRHRPHFVFVPSHSFTQVEIHRHATVRVKPVKPAPRVVVRSGPPNIQFVKRVTKSPVVQVRPNKVNVQVGPEKKKGLVRVKQPAAGPARPKVAVPVGRNFGPKGKTERKPAITKPGEKKVLTPGRPGAGKPAAGPARGSTQGATVKKSPAPAQEPQKPGVKKATVESKAEEEEQQPVAPEADEKTKVRVKVK